MNPVGAIILVVLICLVLGAPRRAAMLAMMAGVLFLTQGQHIQVLGLNLFAVRFLELAGFLRVIKRREFSLYELNRIDHVLLVLYSYTVIVYCLRGGDDKTYVVGQGVDALLCFITFRGLIGNLEDFQCFLRAFLFLLAPYTLMIMCESFTRHNLFAFFGGVDDGTWVRGNRIRCLGSFRQPDTLGMFAASFLPLYVALACILKERKRAVLGICLCLPIAWAANSGGAAAAAAMGLFGWLFWRWRREMRKVRWGIVCMIAALALVMKAPVWYIFSHISSITGGDGFHRSRLIDMAYQNLDKWWLAGMPISDTIDWFPYFQAGTGGADITNQFIAFGLTAGLGAMILFIYLLQQAFSGLGKAMLAIRFASSNTNESEFLLWGLGVVLVVHITDWFGITYFDQMYVIWFLQLAAISSLSGHCLQAEAPLQLETMVDEPMNNRGRQPAIVVENSGIMHMTDDSDRDAALRPPPAQSGRNCW